MRLRASLFVAAAAGLGILSLAAAANAQPYGPHGPGWGPGMWTRGMYQRMCGPSAAGFAEWRLDRLERLIGPTEAQRAKFDDFRAASKKAEEIMRGACPTEIPLTMPGRMAMMEKRTEAMLQAIKAVRPALDALYATLNDEQKLRLDSSSGRGRYWHWRRHW